MLPWCPGPAGASRPATTACRCRLVIKSSKCTGTSSLLTGFRLGLGVLGTDGVGDPLVRDVSLPVDAMGVDLQQDRDVVPGGLGEWNQCLVIASSVPGLEYPSRNARRGIFMCPAPLTA
jgi:hypothetical protein